MTVRTPLYLALDQGGHASRALVFDRQGVLVATASVPITTQRHGVDRVEHVPEEVVDSLQQAIAQVHEALPPGGVVAAAGLATQRASAVCWDRHTGAALSPVLSWQDRRHAQWLEHLSPQGALIRARTGLVLTPHYGASKLRWCLDHLPAVAEARARGALVMGPLASFLVCRLIPGRPLLTDPANASRTQLWALATGDWSPELLALFGIDGQLLPRLVTSRYAYGNLTTPKGPVPLRVVTGDQSAVPFAFGPLHANRAFVNLGTGAFVQRPVANPRVEGDGLLVSLIWSTEDRAEFVREGTVNGAGSALDWLAQQTRIPVPVLLQSAEAAREAGETPPLFINGVAGLGAPYWVSHLASGFIESGTGQAASLTVSLGARTLAVLESIAFLLQVNLRALRAGAPPLTELLITGGLSANTYLCQCLGSLCGLPAWVSQDPEATGRGLARLVAGPAAEHWPPQPGTRHAPVPDPALEKRFQAWEKALATALGPGIR